MKTEKDFRLDITYQAALTMLSRAKTAPKAGGKDNLVYLLLEKDDIKRISAEISRLGYEEDVPYFIRDSKNIEGLDYILVIGAKNRERNVPQCGFCGYRNCAEKAQTRARCAYDLIDLGIAIGSALSAAQLHGVDTRVFFTIGKAAMSLGLLEDSEVAFGLPLSITEKNIFFDRSRV